MGTEEEGSKEENTNPGESHRVTECFIVEGGGWIEVHPSSILRGDLFRFPHEEPGVVNLAMGDAEQKWPWAVQCDSYSKVYGVGTESTAMGIVLQILTDLSSCCLDNGDERREVASRLLTGLSKYYILEPMPLMGDTVPYQITEQGMAASTK